MSKRKDFIVFPRVEFGHLKVIKEADPSIKQSGYRAMYICQCDCGNMTLADRWALESGHKTRCEICSGAINRNSTAPYNRKRQRNNKSGYPGIDFHCGKWRSRIEINRNPITIGEYITISEAIIARKAAEKVLIKLKEREENA